MALRSALSTCTVYLPEVPRPHWPAIEAFPTWVGPPLLSHPKRFPTTKTKTKTTTLDNTRIITSGCTALFSSLSFSLPGVVFFLFSLAGLGLFPSVGAGSTRLDFTALTPFLVAGVPRFPQPIRRCRRSICFSHVQSSSSRARCPRPTSSPPSGPAPDFLSSVLSCPRSRSRPG
ncbi:hypothetical protein B0J15DRAFT_282296 [Fusarium solani]|uniref:Uncharacterized protein n=1 Tax=Fusarium solani TaxID=169388 RepID=A0A9P9HME9_FUSSL|nr:uncharacterized protein B0J15DRAFT_282296 [Fusarium solani]KAH7260230.1 hypothetical protein B0J15DRAFT_282296 [Fusarium solani]